MMSGGMKSWQHLASGDASIETAVQAAIVNVTGIDTGTSLKQNSRFDSHRGSNCIEKMGRGEHANCEKAAIRLIKNDDCAD